MKSLNIFALLVVLISSSCLPERNVCCNSDDTFTLQFEEQMFFAPTGNFFEMHIDMAAKKNRFSKPQSINIDQIVSVEKQYKIINETLPIPNTGKLVLCDMSHDKKWGVFRLIDSVYNKHVIRDRFLYNTATKTVVKLPFIDYLDKVLFSLDSNSFYFNRNWRIMKYDLLTKEEKDLGQDASDYFLTPDRKQIILFNSHTIKLMDISSSKVVDIGSYKYVAVRSGVINSKYAYFVTAVSDKGGPMYLHILNLNTFEIVNCPYSKHDGEIVGVVSN